MRSWSCTLENIAIVRVCFENGCFLQTAAVMWNTNFNGQKSCWQSQHPEHVSVSMFCFSPFVYVSVELQTQMIYRLSQYWCNGFQYLCSELLPVLLPFAPACFVWPISNTWLYLGSVTFAVLRSVKRKKKLVPVCLQQRLHLWACACQPGGVRCDTMYKEMQSTDVRQINCYNCSIVHLG